MTNNIVGYAIFFLVVLKILAIYFTGLGLYGDEAQYWLWSQEPDLGYYSKPPLLAWFLSGYTSLFGSSFFSLKTFPIIIYFFIFYSIYKFCKSLTFDNKSSLMCAIGFLIIPAASLSSFFDFHRFTTFYILTISMIVLLNT
jgi:hypothetical protein